MMHLQLALPSHTLKAPIPKSVSNMHPRSSSEISLGQTMWVLACSCFLIVPFLLSSSLFKFSRTMVKIVQYRHQARVSWRRYELQPLYLDFTLTFNESVGRSKNSCDSSIKVCRPATGWARAKWEPQAWKWIRTIHQRPTLYLCLLAFLDSCFLHLTRTFQTLHMWCSRIPQNHTSYLQLGNSKGKPLGITMSTPTLTLEGTTLHTHG